LNITIIITNIRQLDRYFLLSISHITDVCFKA